MVEALVVLAVIGVMILLAAPVFAGQQASSQDAEARRYLEQAYRLARSQTVDTGGKYGVASMTTATALTGAINLAYPEYEAVTGATAPAAFRAESGDVNLAVFVTTTTPKTLRLRVRSASGKICLLSTANQSLPEIECVEVDAGESGPLPPENTVAPEISGVYAAGETLTSNAGTWDNDPTEFSYQWYRCSSEEEVTCTSAILGETALSHGATADDVGFYLRVRVTASNSAGPAVAWSLPTPLIADTTAPVVAVTAPAGGATVSGTVNVTATASDNVGVVGVQFKRDGVNLGAEDTSAPYSASWVTVVADNGAHTITAVARDAAGNTRTSAAVNITVDNPLSAPVFIAANANQVSRGTSSGTTDTVGVTTPAGTQQNDLLLAQIATSSGTITAPSGWTLARQSGTLAVYYRWAAASEPASYSFGVTAQTFTAQRFLSGAIAAYRGVDLEEPLTGIVINSGAAAGAGTSFTTESLTTTVANTRMVAMFSWTGGTSGPLTAGSATQRWYHDNTTLNTPQPKISGFDYVQASPGATSLTATLPSSTSAGKQTAIIGLTPAGAPALTYSVRHLASSGINGGQSCAAASSVVVPRPTLTVGKTGDLMIVQILLAGTGAATVTPPAGWTEAAPNSSDPDPYSYTYYRVLQAADAASFTFTFSAAKIYGVTVNSYENVHATTPLESATLTRPAAASPVPSASVSAPARSVVLALMSLNRNYSTQSSNVIGAPTNGFTARADMRITYGSSCGSASASQLGTADKALASAATESTSRTMSLAVQAPNPMVRTLVIKPK